LGYPGFSAYATAAKWIHNVLGPVFMVALFIILIKWFKNNLFTKVDIEWFKAFGGMVGDKHPSAGKFNGGEKAWFWTLATAGVALCFSGLVLDFPNFGQEREVIIGAHLIHILTAMLLMAFSLGHIYIGTIGTEGALEGMTTGHVDVAWAEQHHDLWLKEVEQEQQNTRQ
jgi:formate dehydrogenase subunit gamma